MQSFFVIILRNKVKYLELVKLEMINFCLLMGLLMSFFSPVVSHIRRELQEVVTTPLWKI